MKAAPMTQRETQTPRVEITRCSRVRARVLCVSVLCALTVSVASLSAADKADLIVTGGTVITMDSDRRVIENGAVAVRNGKVLAVGTAAEIRTRYTALPANVMSASGRIVMPGLINTHTHAAMSLFRGIADDLRLQEWLEKHIFPAEAKNVTPDFVRWGTRLAALEMIHGGTTTYADMYYFEDTVAETTKEAGMRGVLGETIIDFPVPDAKTPAIGLAQAEKFLQRWKDDPLIVPAVAPHAPYTCSRETLKAAHNLAVKHGVPMLIHVAETETENQTFLDRDKMSAVAYLDSLGVLGPRTLAAHSVWVSPADIEILKRNHTGVAHNPSSNMKLASGAAPVAAMLDAGVAVGLGTDGVAGSNNDVNMFEEMDLAAKLSKLITRDPRSLPAPTAVAMATILGARAMGMEKEIGSLEPGKRADLITVRISGPGAAPHAVPLYDLYSQIAYALKASDVEDVIIQGRAVMRHHQVLTLDEEQIKTQARKIAQHVSQSLR
jgi:5-methylthioadenosine/S-adenosylhomocysteine deaminase